MTTYITLVEGGAVGSVLDGDPIAVTDPRMLPFSDLLVEDEEPSLGELIDGTASTKLVSVVPLTDPVECSNGACTWWEASAWRVTGPAPLAPVLGPQGAEAIEVFKTLASAGLNGVFEPGGTSPADRYYTIANDIFDEMREGENRAFDALEKAGADRHWWETYALACNFGQEIVAVLARDLIGTVPGWTPSAHDVLTAPYRAAFGDGAPGTRKLAA